MMMRGIKGDEGRVRRRGRHPNKLEGRSSQGKEEGRGRRRGRKRTMCSFEERKKREKNDENSNKGMSKGRGGGGEEEWVVWKITPREERNKKGERREGRREKRLHMKEDD